jgi:release factor glutamine methyltransferase
MSAPPDTTEVPWTIGRLLNWTTDHLTRHGIEDARLSTEVLLAHAAGCSRIQLYTRFEEVLNGLHLDQFRDCVRRAARHEPIAYLVERKEFYSLSFRVTRDVLIPRPETEALVECVVDHCGRAGLSSPRLLELGTGSGCIVVALLRQLASATAVATEISDAAIAVARENAEQHNVLDRLVLAKAGSSSFPSGDAAPFDVVVSNPPYVASDAVAGLHASVRDFEPRIALTDEGDGLSFYRSIAERGGPWLTPDGAVIVEIADGAMETVSAVMTAGGAFQLERSVKDRVTGRERVLLFRRR